jgi:hypothetical protein
VKLTFKPEGSSAREWIIKPKRLMNVEAEEIERRTNMTFEEWSAALQKGSMLAYHGLLFVLLRREQPKLSWESVRFCGEDVDLEYELDEKIEIRDNLKAGLDAMDADRAAQARDVIAELDAEIAEEQPKAEDPTAPKAEPPSAMNGGHSSPPSSISIPETLSV